MPKKAAVKRKVVAIPKDANEANDFVNRIGEQQREIKRIEVELNEKIEELKAKIAGDIQEHQGNIDELFDGLSIFSEANRQSLTDGGKKKTVTFSAGILQWHTTPPKVNIRNTEKVLAELKQLGLERFIRKIEEPDKEAMKKEPDIAESVNGVSITQDEEFIVKPNALEIEITKKKKIKKKEEVHAEVAGE